MSNNISMIDLVTLMNDYIEEQTKLENGLDISKASIIALGAEFDYISAVNLETEKEHIKFMK